MSSPSVDAKVPTSFVVVAFAVAIVAGVAIAYFGLHGQIGAGIP